MTLQEIKSAIQRGEVVYYQNLSYTVAASTTEKDPEYFIKCGKHMIGLTWADGETLNGKEEDFFTIK